MSILNYILQWRICIQKWYCFIWECLMSWVCKTFYDFFLIWEFENIDLKVSIPLPLCDFIKQYFPCKHVYITGLGNFVISSPIGNCSILKPMISGSVRSEVFSQMRNLLNFRCLQILNFTRRWESRADREFFYFYRGWVEFFRKEKIPRWLR